MTGLDKNNTDKIMVANSTSSPIAPVQQLIAKDVSRKEFLSIVGLGLLSVAGIAPLIHFLTGKNPSLSIHNIYKSGGGASYSRGKYSQ